MFSKLTIRQICVGAAIAALYVLLTYACAPIAFGSIQFRPAEALTILPLLFVEAVPGLFIGCLIANLLSPFGIWDVAVGSAITLVAAVLTRLVRNVYVGGLFPVLLNSLLLPLMWFLMDSSVGYIMNFVSIFITQAIFVYALGLPLYFAMRKLKPRIYGVRKIVEPSKHNGSE